jgi:hypothetical protein
MAVSQHWSSETSQRFDEKGKILDIIPTKQDHL